MHSFFFIFFMLSLKFCNGSPRGGVRPQDGVGAFYLPGFFGGTPPRHMQCGFGLNYVPIVFYRIVRSSRDNPFFNVTTVNAALDSGVVCRALPRDAGSYLPT